MNYNVLTRMKNGCRVIFYVLFLIMYRIAFISFALFSKPFFKYLV